MSYKIVETCIGCGACERVCPVSAITGHKKSIYEVNPDRCVMCGTCGRVCPKGAIINGEGMKVQKVLRKEWKIPLINTATCSACGVCVDVCGKRAIDISHPVNKTDFKVFAVITDPKNCVGCSLCANECPLQAIEMEVPKC